MLPWGLCLPFPAAADCLTSASDWERSLGVAFKNKVSSGFPDPAPMNNLFLLCLAPRHSL